jgi:hypothetical protein
LWLSPSDDPRRVFFARTTENTLAALSLPQGWLINNLCTMLHSQKNDGVALGMGQLHKPIALMAALLCCGCAGSGRTAASDAEQLASSTYMNCLESAARKLDDHISDAQKVSSGVSNACNWEAEALEKTFYSGLTSEEAVPFLAKLSITKMRSTAAAEAVAQERKAPTSIEALPF